MSDSSACSTERFNAALDQLATILKGTGEEAGWWKVIGVGASQVVVEPAAGFNASTAFFLAVASEFTLEVGFHYEARKDADMDECLKRITFSPTDW